MYVSTHNIFIHRTLTREGRSSGEAYVELETASDMNKTLDKDRELMGKRYIEGFSTSNISTTKISSKYFQCSHKAIKRWPTY